MRTDAIFPTVRQRRKQLLALAISAGLGCLLAITPLQPSIAISVADVPNPQQINSTWVTDMASMLSSTTEAELNQMISELEATNGAEIAVVTVPDTRGASSPKAFATELFNTWGIGKEGADNGVLFLISKGDRRNEIETGYSVEGILTDARLGSILDKKVTPQFKAGSFDAGVLAGTEAMIGLLNGETFSPIAQIQEYAGWLFDGIWLAIGAIALGITTFVRRLNKDHSRSIQISPTGREYLQKEDPNKSVNVGKEKGVFMGPFLTWALRGLVGAEVYQAKGLSLSKATGDGKVGQAFNWATADRSKSHKGTQLVTYQLSEGIVKSWWKLLGVGFGISAITRLIFPEQVWIMPVLILLWLTSELWLNTEDTHQKAPIDQRLKQTASQLLCIGLIVLGVLLCLLILFNVLGLLLSASTATALLFSFAGILRLVRSLPNNPTVVCTECETPMQQLSATQVQQHLRKAEQVEIKLGNTQCEGWHCPTCSPQTASKIPRAHLFYRSFYKPDYEECATCQARTVEVYSGTLIQATTYSTGKKRLTKHCHCCEKHTEKESITPKIKASPSRSRSSSSGHHTSDYSSSASSSSDSGSSYSGSSDSGGSFGGGDSGGGGAGSDW